MSTQSNTTPPSRNNSHPNGKKLLDQYREALRNRHYSHRTEETYVSWVRQFILYHNKRHPREMGATEINSFHQLSRQRKRRCCLHTEPGN